MKSTKLPKRLAGRHFETGERNAVPANIGQSVALVYWNEQADLVIPNPTKGIAKGRG
jgi:hypothetical protein